MVNCHSITTKRTARFYTVGDTRTAATLWVVLHGYGQLAGEFIRDFEVGLDGSRAFVAPEALSRFYLRAGQGKIGANWMTAEDRRNEISDYVDYLDGVVEELQLADHQKIFVLGFSQGSATACRWFASSQHNLSGIALWGGGVPPDLDRTGFMEQLDGGRLEFVYGSEDEYVTKTRLRLELQRMNDLLIPFDVVEYEGGHAIVEDELLRMLARAEGLRAS